jgi:hypothetical protein
LGQGPRQLPDQHRLHPGPGPSRTSLRPVQSAESAGGSDGWAPLRHGRCVSSRARFLPAPGPRGRLYCGDTADIAALQDGAMPVPGPSGWAPLRREGRSRELREPRWPAPGPAAGLHCSEVDLTYTDQGVDLHPVPAPGSIAALASRSRSPTTSTPAPGPSGRAPLRRRQRRHEWLRPEPPAPGPSGRAPLRRYVARRDFLNWRALHPVPVGRAPLQQVAAGVLCHRGHLCTRSPVAEFHCSLFSTIPLRP